MAAIFYELAGWCLQYPATSAVVVGVVGLLAGITAVSQPSAVRARWIGACLAIWGVLISVCVAYCFLFVTWEMLAGPMLGLMAAAGGIVGFVGFGAGCLIGYKYRQGDERR